MDFSPAVGILHSFIPRGSPSPCSASRGMTWERNYYIFRNKDIINTSSHICASIECGRRELFTGANDWDLPLGIVGSLERLIHIRGFSSSRLGKVCKHPLLSLAASVEAGRSPRKRNILCVCEHFKDKPDAEKALLDSFLNHYCAGCSTGSSPLGKSTI